MTLLGITSTLRAYKLAWLINQAAGLMLAQAAVLDWEAAGQVVHFLFETEHCTFRLVKNKVVTGEEDKAAYLFSDLKYVDFFFAVQDLTETFDVDVLCRTLRTTTGVAYISQLDLKAYVDRAHFFFH